MPCGPQSDHALSLFDDRYSIQLGAFAQLQYAATIGDADGPSLVRSDFTVPRARVCASGHAVTRRLRYRLMIGRSIQRELEVNDVVVEWEALEWLVLRLGRFKLPIIHEWIESAQPLATIDRALASRLLLPGRDYGVRVSGRLFRQRLEYLVGVSNGDGDAATRAADTSPAVLARLSLQALRGARGPFIGAVNFDGDGPAIALEAGLLWNRSRPQTTGTGGSTTMSPPLEDYLLNASALLRWDYFDVAIEYIGQRRDNTQAVRWTHAGYARVTYFVPRLWSSVTGRVSWASLPATMTAPKPDDQLELEVDWGLYLDRHHAKLVSRYGALLHNPAGTVEHQLGVQAQIAVF